jgi:hypothetical protein
MIRGPYFEQKVSEKDKCNFNSLSNDRPTRVNDHTMTNSDPNSGGVVT